MLTKAKDGHVCDSVSEALIDNWLTEHGIAHERDARYPGGTNHTADWRVGDTVFLEYFGLAHDSPRYDKAISEKKKICEQHAILLIEIYPQDLYPTMQLSEKIPSLLKVILPKKPNTGSIWAGVDYEGSFPKNNYENRNPCKISKRSE
ncbi:hypothetical protein HY478_01310 [Candidatus Uhrbacteria bacterium]|nr:hypothetical protein [Candidatus Uhrbacteria bacterium]